MPGAVPLAVPVRVGNDDGEGWECGHVCFRNMGLGRILPVRYTHRINMNERRNPRILSILPLVLVVPLAACAQGVEDEWETLFDGETLNGWGGFKNPTPPQGWDVVDGNLTRVGGGGDLVSVGQYGDFELRLEWNISEGGNSGVMFRVDPAAARTFESGPEMQVLDDANHYDGQSPLTSAGANYGLHASPEGVVRPPGEWNEVRLIANGAHVEHWLNGVKVVEYELWSPEWEKLVANSKFIEWPVYGRAERGHIVLQDHGDWVAFRNIRIREIE